jgi:hypothetical protein
MKRRIAILVTLVGLGAQGSLGQAQTNELRSGEWQVSPFATYVDKSGDKWGLGVSLTYFLTKQFGIGGATYWTDFSGTFFDNFEGEAYFRIAQFDRLTPYAVGSIGYQFDSDYWFETFGGGVDFRVADRIKAFGDLQYRIADNNNSQNGIFIRLGVRISF